MLILYTVFLEVAVNVRHKADVRCCGLLMLPTFRLLLKFSIAASHAYWYMHACLLACIDPPSPVPCSFRADMQDKFTQVNEFLKLLGHTGALEQMAEKQQQQQEGDHVPHDPEQQQQQQRQKDEGDLGDSFDRESSAESTTAAAAVTSTSGEGEPSLQRRSSSSSSSSSVRSRRQQRPICILDCGCGSSHLTFGTYHYLTHVMGLPARILGVDTNAALMKRSNDYWWVV